MSAGEDTRGAEGLTSAEVTERVRRGETNAVRERASRSYADILRENVFTLFNLILAVLAGAVLVAGSPKDALFGLVVVLNAAVGVIQEVRAKRTLDRLTLLSAPRARVVRDGRAEEVALDAVVLDDVLELLVGDQVAADGVVLSAAGLEVDQSLLTGESVPVTKAAGDPMLSGTFAVAGDGRFRATGVGEAAYARRLTAEAKRFGLAHSELRGGVNRILKIVLWAMLPIGALTIATQLAQHAGARSATLSTVAALEGMVPQGLVLLTSVAFAVSVVILGRRHVLVQELAAVEVLARVDVVCCDKTGTLTEAALAVDRVEPLDATAPVAEALGAIAALGRNATAVAIAERYPAPAGWTASDIVAFSSARKWSGAAFGEYGGWVLGAPEILLAGGGDDGVRARVGELAAAGDRVVLLARTAETPTPEHPPSEITPAALVLLAERVRPDAAETLAFFREQGVAIKVLSGDNPVTVAAVASRLGLDAGEPVDARALPEDAAALVALMDERAVFGRVTPQDKRRMVEALQSAGHIVAMTGDGVNDVLALKAADLGIAMGSGAGATRAVAQVVLLDGRFATLPGVVAEGRRVIANIERVANLFLTKTAYAVLFALATAAAVMPFPFLPRHLTLVSSLTIGIPAFFLALEPNRSRYRPGFVARVARFAVPAGAAAALATFGAYVVAMRLLGLPLAEARTVATLVLAVVGLWILRVLARPVRGIDLGVMLAMIAALAAVVAWPFARGFFALSLPALPVLAPAALAGAVGVALVELGLRLSGWERTRVVRE